MKSKLNVTILLFAAMTAAAPAATLVGLWEFNDAGDLGKATIGSSLAVSGSITPTSGVSGSDGAATVGVGPYLTATNPIGPNGSSGTPTRTNLYTLVLDFKTPADLPRFSALFDFNLTGDGDYFFLRTTGTDYLQLGAFTTFGYAGNTANNIASNDTWYRLVLAVDNGGTTTSYVNGTAVGNHTTNNVLNYASRSIGSTFRIFDDPDGSEESLMLVSNLALYDGKLTATEVAALGVAGSAIPEPSALALLGLGACSFLGLRRRK